MKKISVMILAICAVLSLAGCRGDDAVEAENDETYFRPESLDSGDLGILSKWQGEFVDDGGHVLLAIRQHLDYDNLIEFYFIVFVEGYNTESGIAEVHREDPDIAEERNGYSFMFLGDDIILVSDSTYEGLYTRDFESTYDWDYNGGATYDDESPLSDTPLITGAFYPGVDWDSSEWFEFYDDSTGVWFISGTENPFHFEIAGDLIVVNFDFGQEEILIQNETTLYWATWECEFSKMRD